MATDTNTARSVPIWQWYKKAALRGAVATDRFMFMQKKDGIDPMERKIGINITYPSGVKYSDVMKDMRNVQELKSGRTIVEISVYLTKPASFTALEILQQVNLLTGVYLIQYDYDTEAYTVFIRNRRLVHLRRPSPRWNPPVGV